ncbi:MAG: hypothetical protein OEZ04_00995, partial [Nitrospinota bacterium]|nr:hypothetical protein [Nitrospinota bacterium]
MEWVEAEAKSNEEAKARIMETLNVTDSAVVEFEEMKVTRRFLGMGGKSVKVRGRLKAGVSPKKAAPAPESVADTQPDISEPERQPAESADLEDEKKPESEKEPIRP